MNSLKPPFWCLLSIWWAEEVRSDGLGSTFPELEMPNPLWGLKCCVGATKFHDFPPARVGWKPCYLGQSRAAFLHLPEQRTGPAWSWSLHSGCSPGAGSCPAWLRALTSTPPCPSRSPCTSSAPAAKIGTRRTKMSPLGPQMPSWGDKNAILGGFAQQRGSGVVPLPHTGPGVNAG